MLLRLYKQKEFQKKAPTFSLLAISGRQFCLQFIKFLDNIPMKTSILLYFFLIFSPLIQAREILDFKIGTSTYTLEALFEGDRRVFWGIEFLNNDLIILTEREGQVFTFNIKEKRFSEVAHNIQVNASKRSDNGTQAGLFDVKKSKDNEWIYFTYASHNGKRKETSLGRGKYINGKIENWEKLFQATSNGVSDLHFGSRIEFINDKIFMSIGDRGIREDAQTFTTHSGKILRLELNGNAPENNPFKKSSSKRAEIWSYGHRNPQGLFYDNDEKILYSAEHGPRGGDEINIIKKGTNYGWPVISYGKEYESNKMVGIGTHKKGMEQPIFTFTPSIAPSSLIRYKGDKIKEWKNYFLLTSLALRHLNVVNIKTGTSEKFLKKFNARLRVIKEGPDGLLYLTSENGKILRIRPKI